MNAHASGSGITGYRWSKDGVALPSTADCFEVAKATLGDAGEYQCSVTGECGTRNETLRIDVRERLKIEKLRDTVAPCEHSPLTFSVDARGYLPKYLWTPPKNSRGWGDPNKAEYANSDIVWSRDTGVYTCRVNTVCGDTTFYRVLQGRQKLEITDRPGDIVACEGEEVRVAAGTNRQPVGISWGRKIGGAYSWK